MNQKFPVQYYVVDQTLGEIARGYKKFVVAPDGLVPELSLPEFAHTASELVAAGVVQEHAGRLVAKSTTSLPKEENETLAATKD